MSNNENGTQVEQIEQILNIDKLFSLSFQAIAFIQYYSTNYTNRIYCLDYGVLIIAVLLVILLIYALWSLLQTKVHNSVKKWLDSSISLIISLASIILTGAYLSNYKFLFLFVIISSSIECSRKISISIAGLSAIIVLATDLITAPNATVNPYFESDIVLACVFLIISWTIGYYVELRKTHIEILNNQVNIDGLTGLYNHRYFYDYLDKQFTRSTEEKKPLSLLFIDIDDFKFYNDLFGHQKGDEVLRSIAHLMTEMFEINSFVARYGGEEFAILLPDTKEEDALEIAEKLRKTVHEHLFDGEENLPSKSLTISIGVSSFPTKARTSSELMKSADEACYRAKFLYKNRVESYYSILEEFQNNSGTSNEIDKDTITSIKTLIAVINAKDKYTYGHVERVVFYSTLIAKKLNFSVEETKKLVYAAYLHDIGKINISREILIKTERLTDEEWETLKSHPQKAEEIIKNISSLHDIVPIILQHHERYDGTGYPNKLDGTEISYMARILTVVDSFDAMTSQRPYQPKKTYIQAINELLRCSGTQFDPDVVDTFISAISPVLISDSALVSHLSTLSDN